MEIQQIVQAQRDYFGTDVTKPYDFRRAALQRLQNALEAHEQEIFDALQADLGKADFESYMTEVGLVKEEVRYAIKKLKRWMRPRKFPAPLAHFPSNCAQYPTPYGVTLVMSPWNYPFQLTMIPLIGSLAAGNCVVVKPSNYSPKTSGIIAKLVTECFEPEHVTVVLGGREQNSGLLQQTFDYIFFTGGEVVGKLVMQSAAERLTPLTLELGGKSPYIVGPGIDLKLAARRIAFGKFINAGQTCVAPDHLYIHSSQKGEFVRHMIEAIQSFYMDDALSNPEYPHIVNDKHYHRILGLLDGANVLYGGNGDEATRKIQPTLVDGVTWDSKVMGEEIFGPILPILTYEDIGEVIAAIKARPHPLAFYLFTTDKATKQRFLDSVTFGGGCINDTLIHVSAPRLPFGGVGNSGMGSYHGRKSFETFSHTRNMVEKASWVDLEMRYLPGTKKHFKAIRRFIH